jgi:hypothetical protein
METVAKSKLPEPREYRQERPRIAILWNGVLLQELGIADFLASADMTLTLGRSRITRQHPQGKPKIGAARLVFQIPTEAAARKFAELLYLDARPMLTVGFGYEGGVSFWVGGAGVRTSPDPKQYSRVAGYKIETVEWKYESSIWTVTLNGMVGRTLRMLESRRPRVYTDKNLLDIAKGMANEFGVTIRIDESLPVNTRMSQIAQNVGEDALNFLSRVSGLLGANLKIASGTPGEMNPYKYEIVGENGEPDDEKWSTRQGQVRTIITIQSIINDFVDISKLEQSRDIVIGYCPHLSPVKFGFDGNSYKVKWDYLASSIQVSDERSAVRTATAQKVNKEGKTEQTKTNVLELSLPEFVTVDGKADISALKLFKATTAAEVEPAPIPASVETRSAPPATVSSKDMEESRIAGIVLSAGIKTKLTITLKPGAPFLDPGKIVQVIGTPTHDGAYGIEETQISFTASDGLKTTHICRPLQKAARAKTIQEVIAEASKALPNPPLALSLPYLKDGIDTLGLVSVTANGGDGPPAPPMVEPVPDTAADESAGVSIDPGDTGFPADTGGF